MLSHFEKGFCAFYIILCAWNEWSERGDIFGHERTPKSTRGEMSFNREIAELCEKRGGQRLGSGQTAKAEREDYPPAVL